MPVSIRAVMALGVALFVLASPGGRVALGQLTSVGSPQVTISPGLTTVTQPPGGEFALTTTGDLYLLQGDAHFRLPADPVASSMSIYVFSTQRVTVGPLPVQITPVTSGAYKLVNGGGPASSTFPSTTVHTEATLFEFDSTGDTRTVPVLQSRGEDHTRLGNGFTIVDETHAPIPSYVLGGGLTYDLGLFYQIDVDLTGAPDVYPTIAITLEAGGISDWAGLSVDWNAVTVPEPGMGVAAAAAAVTLLAAPRRPRRQSKRCSA
jgi:hypothetical protein